MSVSALLLISLIFSCRFSCRSRTAVSTLSLISLRIFSKLTLLKGSNVWQRISWKVISAAGTAFCVRFLLSQEFYSQQCINGVIFYLSAGCREMLLIQADKILICMLGSKSTSVCSCHPRPWWMLIDAIKQSLEHFPALFVWHQLSGESPSISSILPLIESKWRQAAGLSLRSLLPLCPWFPWICTDRQMEGLCFIPSVMLFLGLFLLPDSLLAALVREEMKSL